MATAQVKFDFPSQLKDARKKIRDCFKRMHEILQVRENSLLSRIDEIKQDHDTKTRVMQELSDTFSKLNVLNSSSRKWKKKTDKLVTSTIDDKIKQLTDDLESSIEFEWDVDLEADLEQMGSIFVNSQTIVPCTCTFLPGVKEIVPDYEEKHFPTTYLCEKSSDKAAYGEFNNPTSIAIHYRTGNIYIADMGKHSVQVFNSDGNFLFMFSEKMNNPRGISVSPNTVYVTQSSSHCINMYELEGELIKRVGSKGKGRAQFDYPMGMDYSERTEMIYICDRFNDRVQVMTDNAKFRSMLGVHLLDQPIDIKVTRERIFVLDSSILCMLIFNSDHDLINRMIGRGDGEQTRKPYCFDVDRDYNIIMSDSSNNRVYIFDEEGEKIHKFGQKGQDKGDLNFPYGIALDNFGRIIVVCEKDTNCLQFF